MSTKPPYYSSSAPDEQPSLGRQIHDAKMTLSAEPSIVAITPEIYLGNYASSISPGLIMKRRITSIISVTSTPPTAFNRSVQNRRRASMPEVSYHNIRCKDNDTADLLQHLPQLYDDIEKLTRQGRILVHCSQGMSRSPAAVVGYLMKKRGKGIDSVLAEVKRKRDVKIRENFMEQLRVWEECQFELYENEKKGGLTAKKPYRRLLQSLDESERRARVREERERAFWERHASSP